MEKTGSGRKEAVASGTEWCLLSIGKYRNAADSYYLRNEASSEAHSPIPGSHQWINVDHVGEFFQASCSERQALDDGW